MDYDNESVASSYAPLPPARFKRPPDILQVPSASFQRLLEQLNGNLDRVYISNQGKVSKSSDAESHSTDVLQHRVEPDCRQIKHPVGEETGRNLHRTFRVPKEFRSQKIRRHYQKRKHGYNRTTENLHKSGVKVAEVPTLDTALHKLHHYRLNFRNLPFIPYSKPSAPSYNLTANLQQVIGKLKMHHPQLCQSNHCNESDLIYSNKLEEDYAKLYRKYELLKLEIASSATFTRTDVLLDQKKKIKNQLKQILILLDDIDKGRMLVTSRLEKVRYDDESPTPLSKSQKLLKDLKTVQSLFDSQ